MNKNIRDIGCNLRVSLAKITNELRFDNNEVLQSIKKNLEEDLKLLDDAYPDEMYIKLPLQSGYPSIAENKDSSPFHVLR